MKYRLFIVAALSTVHLALQAQQNGISSLWKSKTELADQLFEDKLYDAAVSMYMEEALAQNIFLEDGTVSNRDLALKIGDTFYKLRKLDQASKYYSYVLEHDLDSIEVMYMLRYAEGLLFQSKIEEAKYWFNEYYKQSLDPKGKERFTGTVIYDELMASIKPTTIKNLVFNGPTSFIAPKMVEGSLYFSGPRANSKWFDQQFLQGDMELFELFVLDSNGVQTIETSQKLFNVSSPVFLKEDKVLVTAASRKDGRLKLYAGRIMNGYKWGSFAPSVLNDAEGSIHSAGINETMDTLYLSSDRPGGFGGFDLYYSAFQDSVWSTLINMGPFVNTSGNEIYPFHSKGHLCFSSDGHPGLGGFDLFEVDNDEVVNLASPLNTPRDDLGIVYTDENHGYFFSNREGGEGKDDLYSFTQTESPEVLFELSVTRKVNEAMVSDAVIEINSLKGDHKVTISSDESGQARTMLHTRTNYIVTIEQEGFIRVIDTVSIQLESVNTSYQLDELYTLHSLVFSAETNAAIANPVVFTENLNTGQRTEVAGNTTGFFEIKQPSNTRISILITKEGYGFVTDTIGFDKKEITKTYTLEKVQPAGSLTLTDLLYELDQHKLQDDYVPVLDSIAESLERFASLRIIIESHTDSRGEKSYNQQLSQLRAEAVKEYLISKGVEQSRIGAVGKGEENVLNECLDGVPCSDEKHRVNRRTEVKLFRANFP